METDSDPLKQKLKAVHELRSRKDDGSDTGLDAKTKNTCSTGTSQARMTVAQLPLVEKRNTRMLFSGEDDGGATVLNERKTKYSQAL